MQDLTSVDITPESVKQKLTALNPNKSPGYDKWHPYFLRELADDICTPISILFNKSIIEGAHNTWQKSIITAIDKKGQRNLPENYQPVSLTSVISKIMESLIRDAIVDHLVDNELLTEEQHSFVPGRDCMTQLIFLLGGVDAYGREW